jgi:hypothetical protein
MKDWPIWIAGAFIAYLLLEKFSTGVLTTAVSGYAPIPNATGDQFQCPVGTKFTEIESMVSGSGICS